MRAKIVMLADDLTGAADCVAEAAARGYEASVGLYTRGMGDGATLWSQSEILSIDANTRYLDADEAARVTTEAAELCLAHAADAAIFKKVDSTLRGNMAVELAAVLRVARRHIADQRISILLAPAMPAQGRTTIDGRQLVYGRPLIETDLWKLETRPPHAAIVEHLFEAGLSSLLIGLSAVRSGVPSLRTAIEERRCEADVIVCDAETEENLRTIAEASADLLRRMILAGSAGLAAQVPSGLGIQPSRPPISNMEFAYGPTLFVVGTGATVSREQAHRLADHPDVSVIQPSVVSLLRGETIPLGIDDALREGRDALVMLQGDVRCAPHETRQLTRAVATLVAPCARGIGGLVVTGGETARAVLEELRIEQIRVLGEVEPGLPFSVAEGWTQPLPILTKAGGFGQRDTLVGCREFMRALKRSSQRSEQQRGNSDGA